MTMKNYISMDREFRGESNGMVFIAGTRSQTNRLMKYLLECLFCTFFELICWHLLWYWWCEIHHSIERAELHRMMSFLTVALLMDRIFQRNTFWKILSHSKNSKIHLYSDVRDVVLNSEYIFWYNSSSSIWHTEF